jgi:aminoglycoside phosphotransferase family enzyme/predicted kinase
VEGMNKTESNITPVLIKKLLDSTAYSHSVNAIRLIETHISWVLLTGEYAYKIKKPVNFGFLDFSTLAKRHFFCDEEIRLNQRLAPDLYIEVVPITGSHEQPKMGGRGNAIEYAVKMRQFPSVKTLRERAEDGDLSTDDIDQIAQLIAHFHQTTDKAAVQSHYGTAEDIQYWFVENFEGIRPLLNDAYLLRQLWEIECWGISEWQDKVCVLQTRRQEGFIRDCHGDLHLGNMTFINGEVRLFDRIEFNPMLRWIDVISEVAFLVIDLLHAGYHDYAYRFLNRYLQDTGDYHGVVLLRYYLVYRALVRAKIALLRMTQRPSDDCQQAGSDYAALANLAERFSQNNPVFLIITHGFSGSGKSTFASQLSEKIGGLHLRSDLERKRIFGYHAQQNTGSGMNSGVYTSAAGAATYQRLAELAKTVLAAGFSVIVDATFLKMEQRTLFRQLAVTNNHPFFIMDVQAPNEALRRRIEQRHHDASEATLEVLHQQQQSAQVLTNAEQNEVISVDTENDNALEILLTRLQSLLSIVR